MKTKHIEEEATVELELSNYKLEHIGPGNGPENYKLYQKINNEWQIMRFVQNFKFEITMDSKVGKITMEVLDL